MSSLRPTLTVVGRRLEPEHHRLRDFLTRIAQSFEWIEAGTAEADGALGDRGLAGAELPVVIDGEESVTGATVERLVEEWHLTDPPSRTSYDLAVVGAGPAGLASAVYSASDGLSTLVVERDVPGGQASHTSLIENFFGFPGGIGGAELARLAGRQAEGFGAELVFPARSHRKRGPRGRLLTMLVRGESLGRSMSAYLVERIAANPRIDVRLRTVVEAVEADGDLLSAVTVRSAGGAAERLPVRALFLCLGGQPRTGWAADSGVATDAAGFVLTGPDLLDAGRRPAGWRLARDPLALETSAPGLFVAGDARHGSAKRVAGAVGEGAMAAALVHRRLDELSGLQL